MEALAVVGVVVMIFDVVEIRRLKREIAALKLRNDELRWRLGLKSTVVPTVYEDKQ